MAKIEKMNESPKHKEIKIRDVGAGEHRCTQTQCSYYVGQGATSCKACKKCQADPFIINDSCQVCFDCENIPESLRFEDPNLKKDADKNNPEKVFLELMKEAAEERLRQIAAAEKGQKQPIENTTPQIEIIIPER